ncbi:hypothetical protein OGAPHI_004354 [Ogataea philodendri]|uniref:Uncharacterized protein n=1 Tax=Ogataea philodendri TaxID=1378263 RepID=A0A9P8P6J4_9ASCO|nr:uncharacterized protein OGAPHI_004354 [Ogataea philodendri]KAH3666165.1 hypothetical protein OGAPHI_004354 [Ogataea philodendri]
MTPLMNGRIRLIPQEPKNDHTESAVISGGSGSSAPSAATDWGSKSWAVCLASSWNWSRSWLSCWVITSGCSVACLWAVPISVAKFTRSSKSWWSKLIV